MPLNRQERWLLFHLCFWSVVIVAGLMFALVKLEGG